MTDTPLSLSAVCALIGDRDGYTIRPWDVADSRVLVEAWHDAEIARWNPVPPEPTLSLAESWILGTSQQNQASVGIDVVLVRDQVVGEIGLQIDPPQSIAEFGFWIAEPYRGQGASKILVTFAELLAEALELRGLVALVEPENAAAVGLLTSVGWNEVPTKSVRRAFASRRLT